jgi:uncharacterized phage-associated protein
MEQVNYNKFVNTVLLLLERCEAARPGQTHLLKMLWYADYWHYLGNLKLITDAQYVALERGPVPDGYKALFQRMEKEKIIKKHEVTVFGQPEPKIEYEALMDPDENQFTQTESEVLARVIRECGTETGNSLSHRTHREGPWQHVWTGEPGRPIPLGALRWLDNLPTDADVTKAKKTLARAAVRRELSALAAR